jgi:tRNA 2-thiocytidine biosynthesis protein TtcA
MIQIADPKADPKASAKAPLAASPKAEQKASYDKNKLHKRLRRETGKAIEDFNMIEEGDKVMVCISGGKDSLTMLDILMSLQRHAPINFELVAVNLDQKQPDFPEHILPEYFTSIGVPYKILEEDTYSLVKEMVPAGKTYCGWCSRFRRGILYKYAKQEGFTKVALGHHRDDMLGTLFLNLFYGGKMKTIVRKRISSVIRSWLKCPLFRVICAAHKTICSAKSSEKCSSTGRSSIPGASIAFTAA